MRHHWISREPQTKKKAAPPTSTHFVVQKGTEQKLFSVWRPRKKKSLVIFTSTNKPMSKAGLKKTLDNLWDCFLDNEPRVGRDSVSNLLKKPDGALFLNQSLRQSVVDQLQRVYKIRSVFHLLHGSLGANPWIFYDGESFCNQTLLASIMWMNEYHSYAIKAEMIAVFVWRKR